MTHPTLTGRISYKLSPAAQRAAMIALNVPVSINHELVEEFPTDLLDAWLVKILPDGSITVDLTKPIKVSKSGRPSDADDLSYGFTYGTIPAELDSIPSSGIQAVRDRLAAVETMRAEAIIEAARIAVEEKERATATVRENTAKRLLVQPAIDAFLAMPSPALQFAPSSWIVIPSTDPSQIEVAPATWVDSRSIQLTRELLGKDMFDQLADHHNEQLAAAEREQKRAHDELETAKRAFLAEWIATHGTESQKARSAAGLLPTQEALSALKDFVFSSVSGITYNIMNLPSCVCISEDCLDDECEVIYSFDAIVDGLTEPEFERLSALQIEGATIQLFTHRAVHACDHVCIEGTNTSAMLSLTVGPFTLQREFVL